MGTIVVVMLLNNTKHSFKSTVQNMFCVLTLQVYRLTRMFQLTYYTVSEHSR